MNTKICLGDKVKCKYTGFTGIVMARTEFINGCVQMIVSEKYDKKKAGIEIPVTEMPIDEQSLILVDTKLRRVTPKQLKEAEETLDALEDEEESYTGGPAKRINRRNY